MRNPAFEQLLDEIKALHDSKNHDYTPDADPLANLRRSEDFGVPAWKGVLVRLSDKWSRIEQLASGKSPKHESLRDSLIDNAVYSLLAVLLLEEHKPAIADETTAFGMAREMFEEVDSIAHEDGYGFTRKQGCKMGGCKANSVIPG